MTMSEQASLDESKKIHNPSTGQWVVVTCTGCMCHDLPMQFGEPVNGCCNECGCPKNLEGWDSYLARYPERLRSKGAP